MSQVRLKWVRATAVMRIGPGNSAKTGILLSSQGEKIFSIVSALDESLILWKTSIRFN